jgi:hypothetical protein
MIPRQAEEERYCVILKIKENANPNAQALYLLYLLVASESFIV